jgi:hypothetical protein
MSNSPQWYIIRNYQNGSFYDFELSWLVLCLLLAERSRRRSLPPGGSYYAVLLVGSLYWSLIEVALYLGGARDGSSDGLVNRLSLFGQDVGGGVLPGIIRGVGEGACLTLIGLVPADMHLSRLTRRDRPLALLYLLLLLSFVGVTAVSHKTEKEVGVPDVDSRRALLKVAPLATTAGTAMLGAYHYFWTLRERPLVRRRLVALLLALGAVGLGTNYLMFFLNVRWVEVDGDGDGDGEYERAPFYIEHAALIYDAVIEIAVIYVPFLSVPYALKWIKTTPEEEDELEEQLNDPLFSTDDKEMHESLI